MHIKGNGPPSHHQVRTVRYRGGEGGVVLCCGVEWSGVEYVIIVEYDGTTFCMLLSL